MANDLKEKYPYLSQHKDFALVYLRYSEARLNELESVLKEYKEYVKDGVEEGWEPQPLVLWYNGDITTEELFNNEHEEWHHIADNANAVFYVTISGNITTWDEAWAITNMLSNDIPKDADHIGNVKDYTVRLDGYTFEEKNGYATYAVSCQLGTIPERPEDDIYYDDFNPMRRLEASIKSALADKGFKVIQAIDRNCDVTLALSIDGITDLQDAQWICNDAWAMLQKQNSDCYLEVKQGDIPNVFLVDYGYNEVVPVIEGYAGSYYEPPYPDEYDTWEAEEKAEEMGKELKAAIEGLGHTVTECTVCENRVESDERLDDKKALMGIVERLGVMEAGESTTVYGIGERNYAVKVTKPLDSESHVVDLEIREGELREGGYHIIGRIDNVPYNMFAHALDKLIQDETNPHLTELLSVLPKNAIKKDSQEHTDR